MQRRLASLWSAHGRKWRMYVAGQHRAEVVHGHHDAWLTGGGLPMRADFRNLLPHLDRIIIKHGTPGVKEALCLLGFEGMRPRLPIARVDEDASAQIRGVLVAEGLLE